MCLDIVTCHLQGTIPPGVFGKQEVSMAAAMGCWVSFMIVRTSAFTLSKTGTAGGFSGRVS